MKISTKSRYALRIMIYLAEHYTLGYIPLKDISDQEELSLKYVEHIMSKLVKSGLVIGLPGSHGGYKLSRLPSEYNVNQILKLMETNNCFTPCSLADKNECPRKYKCISTDVWQLVQTTIDELLDNVSLVDILRMQEEKLQIPSLYLAFLKHKK